AASVDQAARQQIVLREALLERTPRQGRAARRIAEPELAAHPLREAARLEIGARECALLAVPEHLLVERGRALHQLRQLLLALARAIGLGRDLLVLDLDTEALCERLDRADEVDLLELLDERERVATLAAA